ncbi:mucin-2-like [Pelobates fuscus]|uniref:mucin-2-like n=1 Tax=Pelobates fuscus TaxID=191477 RepID=UPI002FE4851C
MNFSNAWLLTAQLLLLGLLFIDRTATTDEVICPPNTQYGCKRICFSNCDNMNSTTEACILLCELGCDCMEGYVFKSKDSSVCVPVSECAVICPQNMEFRPFNRLPQETCKTLGIHYTPLKSDLLRCVCKDGYVLSNEPTPTCIKKSQCPK